MNLFRLFIWEFEQEWKTPILELILAGLSIIAFIAPLQVMFSLILYSKYDASSLPLLLNITFSDMNIFIILSTIIIASRSIAGKIERNEISLLLSYPIRRIELVITPLLMVIMILLIPSGIFIYGSLYVLGIPNVVFIDIIMILLFLLNLLFVYSLVFLISTYAKSTSIAILGSLITFFGYSYIYHYIGGIIENMSLENISKEITENIFSLSKILTYITPAIIFNIIIFGVIFYISLRRFINLEV